MNNNYNLILEKTLKLLLKDDKVPDLLLHSCCAPCSTYVILYLSNYFNITLFFYNPNIMPDEEYNKRLEEQKKFIEYIKTKNPIRFVEGSYNYKLFLNKVKGLEMEREGSLRCFKCYKLRLEETAKYAKNNNYDYFATTLTVSPYKNAQKINEIGIILGESYKINYLVSDFKKKDGYKKSIEISKKYNLYRQSYCGCSFSNQKIN